MINSSEISAAQWEIMRLLWTFQQATSTQLHEQLQAKCQWKIATTKTLLHRLVEKKCVGVKKQGKAYLYYPLLSEHEANAELLKENLFRICQKCRGQALMTALEEIPLSQTDIDKLVALLTQKKQTAPNQLTCDCLIENCRCQDN